MVKKTDAGADIPEAYAVQSQLALPYLPTPQPVIDRVVEYLRQWKAVDGVDACRAMDLGAGDGRVVKAFAEAFPKWMVKGVEINAELSASAQDLVHSFPNASIARADLFQEDLSPYDVIFLFALPPTMPHMRHLFGAVRPGAIFITFQYALDIPSISIEQIYQEAVAVEGRRVTFFVYRRR